MESPQTAKLVIQVFLGFLAVSHFLSVNCWAANILVYPDDVMDSKQFQYVARLSMILAESGHHKVTLLTNSKLMPTNVKSDALLIKSYAVPDSINLSATESHFSYSTFMYQSSGLSCRNLVERRAILCEALLRRQYLMIQLQMEEFDALLIDSSNICGRALSDYLAIPTIVWAGFNFDFDCEVSYDCVSSDMWNENKDIWGRLEAVLRHVINNQLYKPHYIFKSIDTITQHLNINHGMLVSETFLRRKPLFILNMDFIVDIPRPILPFAIPIAGIWKEEVANLPSEIEEYFHKSRESGIIYIDVGFGNQWPLQGQLIIFLQVLLSLGQNIVIQHQQKLPVDSARLKYIPRNLHKNVLGHLQTKLFVSICEPDTMHEVAHFGVPVIILSLFENDAMYCQNIIARHNIGKSINILQSDFSEIKHQIENVMKNEVYGRNSKKLARTFNKQISSSKEKFLFWVEYVINNNGADNLYSSASTLMWYQYFMIDLVFLILLVTIVSLIFFYFLVVCLSRKFKKQKQN